MYLGFNIRPIRTIFTAILIFVSVFGVSSAQGSPTAVPCGTVLEAELTVAQKSQDYLLQVAPGTTITFSVEPIGTTFNPIIYLSDATGARIQDSSGKNIDGYSGAGNLGQAGASESVKELMVSSRNPTLKVQGYSDSIGAYDLSLGCTLRDGTVINPGDSAPPPQPPSSSNSTSFSGTGFPGLAPVDFSNAFTNEITFGQAAKSKIPPSGDAVLGYTFDAAANDTLALNFTRVSGNLNLGLVVLSADNKVVFQTSLVTSSELSTKLTLPTAGTYTIGIFRIDLLPPDAPEATAFQLTATLNP